MLKKIIRSWLGIDKDNKDVMAKVNVATGKSCEAIRKINALSTGDGLGTKTLHNSTVSGARVNVKDISVVGNGDMFRLLCKASSKKEGWMKSTKAMEISDLGCLVQVTTQQMNTDGSYAVAEALAFVSNATIVKDENNGRKLVRVKRSYE